MKTRLATNAALFALLWFMLSYVFLQKNLSYVPLHLTIITALLGVAVGAVSGFVVAKRRLNSLGVVVRTRLSKILFLIGELIILISLMYFFVYYTPNIIVSLATNILFPAFSAFEASMAIVFFRWERKHQELLIVFSKGLSERLDASPKTD
jgi:hypothetical protein